MAKDIRLLKESSMNRVLDKHLKEMCFMISAERENYTDEEKKQKTEELKRDLINFKLSYIPIGGGFVEDVVDKKTKKPIIDKETGKTMQREVIEHSFLVLPYKYSTKKDENGDTKKTNEIERKAFFKIGVHLTAKYDQMSFLFIRQDDDNKMLGRFFTGKGLIDSDMPDLTGVSVNDLKQEYFSALDKNEPHFTDLKGSGKSNRRFSTIPPEDKRRQFREKKDRLVQDRVDRPRESNEPRITEDLFIAENPMTYNERRKRRMNGEVLSPFIFID